MLVLLLVLSVCFTASPIQTNLKLKQTNRALLEALRELTQETQVGTKECRWCDCVHWDEHNYSQCSPIPNQAAGTYHTVKCREDGVTPMPGFWTHHDEECAKYSGGTTWVVGHAGDGKSCDDICGDAGLFCWREGLEIATKEELSSVCQEVAGWSLTAKGTRDIRPHTNTQTQACYGYDLWDTYPASCSAVPTDPSYERICSCLYTYEKQVGTDVCTGSCANEYAECMCCTEDLWNSCENVYIRSCTYGRCGYLNQERAVGGDCDHITEANKSYECTPYYQNIKRCSICLDDGAGAVDNSAINSGVLDFEGFGN